MHRLPNIPLTRKLTYSLATKVDSQAGLLHRISISPDGRWIALAEAGTVNLVELSGYRARYKIQCAPDRVNDVTWTPDGRLLCARGFEIAMVDLSLVDHENQIEISGYPLKMKNIKYVSAIDVGNDMCIAAGGDDVIQLVSCSGSRWRIVGTIDHPPPTAFSGAQAVDVTSLNWYKGSDQLTLVASYAYHGVVGWNISFDKYPHFSTLSWSITTDRCYKTSVSRDGSKLLVGKEGEGFHLYARETAAQIGQYHIPPESSGRATPVCFVHGDFFFAGGSETGKVRLWDINSPHRIQTLEGAEGPIVDISAYYKLEERQDDDIFIIVGATHNAAYVWKAREET